MNSLAGQSTRTHGEYRSEENGESETARTSMVLTTIRFQLPFPRLPPASVPSPNLKLHKYNLRAVRQKTKNKTKPKKRGLCEDGGLVGRPCSWAGSTVLIIPGRREPRTELLLQLALCELSYSQESKRKHCTLFQRMMGGGRGG